MASRDPFDNVLRTLGLYQVINDLNSIPPAAILGPHDNAQQVPFHMLVMDSAGNLAAIEQVPDVLPEIRKCWALKLIKFLHPTSQTAGQIRSMNLIVTLDGTAQARPVHSVLAGNGISVYPVRYRITISTISDLPLQEQVWRAEKFALGTLLYEIFTGHRPFQGLADDAVQGHYRAAEFPQDLDGLPLCFQSLIYACWSAEFGRYIALGKFQRYMHDNPARFALQAAGAIISTAAFITVPVLGAIGFSALGPVAGSVAAGWQASIGVVEAGSLFAICQSAAMGGVAATGLTATGTATAAVAMAASGLPGASSLRSMFVLKFRRGPMT